MIRIIYAEGSFDLWFEWERGQLLTEFDVFQNKWAFSFHVFDWFTQARKLTTNKIAWLILTTHHPNDENETMIGVSKDNQHDLTWYGHIVPI